MLFHVQLTHKCVVRTFEHLHHLALTATPAAVGKERKAHIIVGECVARIAFGHYHRLAVVVGVKEVVTIIVALERAQHRGAAVSKLVATEGRLNEITIEHKVVENTHTQCACRRRCEGKLLENLLCTYLLTFVPVKKLHKHIHKHPLVHSPL